MSIRQEVFQIVSDGCEDNISNNRKTDKLMKVFIEKALPIAVEAARRILVERNIISENIDKE